LSSLGIAVLGAAIALTLFFVEKNIVDVKNSVKATDQPVVAGPANSEEDFF
jgi:PTS system mannose-specific IIC component/fructoselysine and glucoselysine-specific PTS system IIC component